MSPSIAEYSDETLNDLSDYFHGAPIGLHVTSADGTITRTNLAELALLGYSGHEDEYVGRGFAEFHADPEALQLLIDRLAKGQSVTAYDTTLLRRDGSPQRVLLYVNARVEGGALQGMRCFTFPHPADLRADISELAALTDQSVESRRLDLTLEQRHALYQELRDFFDNGPVGLHIVSGDGLIKHANKAELANLGYDASVYLGTHIARFHAEESVINGMLETLVAGTPLVNFSATLFRSDGSRLPVMIYSNSRMRDGSFVNTRCFTVSVPQAHAASVERGERFSWPRNEDFGFTLPGREVVQETQNPMTVALKYIASRKRPEESLGFLARTSQVLGATKPLEAIVRDAAALCVPFLADVVSIDLAIERGSGHLAHACATSLQARVDAIVRELAGFGRGAGAGAVETRVDLRVESGAGRGASLRELGLRSLIVAPLTIRGEHVGTVGFVREDAPSRRVFGPADVALAEEVARRISFAVEIDRLSRRIPR